MTVVEALLAKARDYELLALSHDERAPVNPESEGAAVGFVVVAIALREVADALRDEDDA